MGIGTGSRAGERVPVPVTTVHPVRKPAFFKVVVAFCHTAMLFLIGFRKEEGHILCYNNFAVTLRARI